MVLGKYKYGSILKRAETARSRERKAYYKRQLEMLDRTVRPTKYPTADSYLMRKYLESNPQKKPVRVARNPVVNRVGQNKSSNESKTRVIATNAYLAFDAILNMNSRTLYGFDCTAIPRFDSTATSGSTSSLRESRLYTSVMIKGIKILAEIKNNSNSSGVYFNFALISCKNSRPQLNDGTSGYPLLADLIASDGFLRSYASSRDENLDSTLSSLVINHAPISTDQYNVIKHERFFLGPTSELGNTSKTIINTSSSDKSYQTLNMYVPINRQFVYNDDGTTECETPIFGVYWCDQQFVAPAAAASANLCTIQLRPITFYVDKNTCCAN